MKNRPENELLSAYLDGELTAAERKEIDQLLAQSPSARKLLDDLRALGDSLKSLPKQELGEDLGKKVLQIAAGRKAISSGDYSREPSHSRPRQLAKKIADGFTNNPRMIVWPLIIVTVAVLLMVYNPEQHRPGVENGNRDLALKNGQDDNRAVGAKIVESNNEKLVKAKDQPSISAVKPSDMNQNSAIYAANDDKENKTSNKPSSPPMPPSAPLMIVQCHVSRDVLQQASYRKLLESNHIVFSEESATDALRLTAAERAAAIEATRDRLGDNAESTDSKPEVELVLVEASSDEVGHMLNGLNSTPDKFRDVAVRVMRTSNAPLNALAMSKDSAEAKPHSSSQQAETIATAPHTPPEQLSSPSESSTPKISRAQRIPFSALKEAIDPPPMTVEKPPATAPRLQRVLFVFHVVDSTPAKE